MAFDYQGRTVFVSGGTSGINLGIAEAFAASGAAVFVISRKPERVEAAVAGLNRMGTADGCPADVRDMEAVKAALARCRDRFGQIDVLVSGAAGNFPAYATDISSNGFRAVMEIDVLGTHHVMTAAWPVLRKPGASVINISAPQAWIAMTGQAHVCAAKAGIDMITRTLALEWGPAGVRVNSVAPGPVDDTEGMRRLAPTPEATAAVIARVPLRRMGLKRDVANLCLFLGSDLAGYISGTVIPVDGASSLDTAATMLDSIMQR